MRNKPCSGCGRNVNTKSAEPVCRACRKARRVKRCAWCTADYDSRDKDTVTCSQACGHSHRAWKRYGWTGNIVMLLIKDCAPEMLATNADAALSPNLDRPF
jgi:hypothetical protein